MLMASFTPTEVDLFITASSASTHSAGGGKGSGGDNISEIYKNDPKYASINKLKFLRVPEV